MERFKEKLVDLWERFKRSLTPKNIVLFTLALLAIIAILAGITWLTYKLLEFTILHIDLLILGGSIFGCFVYWLHKRSQVKDKQYRQQQQEQQSIDEEREQKRCEDAYTIIRRVLHLVLNDSCHITKLPRVTNLSSLDSPTRYTKANGYYTFSYLVAKGDSTMDLTSLKEILNVRIKQGLDAQTFNGLSQSVYIHTSGIHYQICLIHKIQDMGNFLQIDMCFAGKNYADFVERTAYVESTSKAGTYDIDF